MRDAIERYWHAFFKFGIFIKGFNGIWETGSGLAILLISKTGLGGWFYLLAQNELLEDPHDSFINFFIQILQTASASAAIFAAVYILFHGVLNLFLAIQLYRNKLWAYIFTLWAMSAFLVYQIYRVVLHHSSILIVLTVFDIIFIILTWHEYLHQKNKLPLAA